MSILKTYQYNGTTINFKPEEGNGMVNASQMAKCFCREVYSFTRSEKTQAFINVLIDREIKLQTAKLRSEKSQTAKKRFERKDIRKAVIIKKRHGKVTNTWMNYQLALKFAAWLSPEFEVWVYDKILDLIQNGTTTLNSQPTTTKKKATKHSDWFNKMEGMLKGDTTRTTTENTKVGPITNDRLQIIHNELDSYFKLWQAQDAAEAEAKSIEYGLTDIVSKFFKKHRHFKFGDAIMALPQVLEGIQRMGFKHDPFYGIDDPMTEEEAGEFVVFLKELNVYCNRLRLG